MKTFIPCCLLLLIACHSTPPEIADRIALVDVRYLEDTRELRGQLSIYAGDSLSIAQPLRFPGQVAFLGSGTEEVMLPGPTSQSESYRYETTLRADYPTDLRFSLPGPDSTTTERQTIDLRMVAPDLAAFPDTIRLREGIQFRTPADSLRSSESILLFFTHTTAGAVRRVLVAGPTRTDRISIPRGAINQIEPGSYRLYLIKSQRVDTTTNGLHAKGAIEYYTREKDVVVVE